MSLPELDFSLPFDAGIPWRRDEVQMARGGIAFLREKLTGAIPTVEEIRLYRPARSLFESGEYATDPTNPHNEAHYGSGLTLLANFVRVRRISNPSIALDTHVLKTAFQWHDLFQGRWRNNPFHGREAAEAFWQASGDSDRFTGAQREVIRWILEHHSELHDPPESPMRDRHLDTLHTFQDVDASTLARPYLYPAVPIEAIFLRTPEARFCGLPYVSKLLEAVSEYSATGDLFEDQLLAGVRLGLLAPAVGENIQQLVL